MRISRRKAPASSTTASSSTSTFCKVVRATFSSSPAAAILATAAVLILGAAAVASSNAQVGGERSADGNRVAMSSSSTRPHTRHSSTRPSDDADGDGGNTRGSSSSNNNSSSTGNPPLPRIWFEQVPADEDGVLRYAARWAQGGGGTGKSTSSSVVASASSSPLSAGDWIRLMTHEDRAYAESLAMNLTAILQEAPFGAFRFETPGVSPASVDRSPFEFALVQDPYLEGFAAKADPGPFSEFLAPSASCPAPGQGGGVASADGGTGPAAACAFPNLGGDAWLVAPRAWPPVPLTAATAQASTDTERYGHLAAFVRGASPVQVAQVWRTAAETLGGQLLWGGGGRPRQPADQPLWFSTAGTGVAWLHFRLDSRPKYYLYRPFKEYESH